MRRSPVRVRSLAPKTPKPPDGVWVFLCGWGLTRTIQCKAPVEPCSPGRAPATPSLPSSPDGNANESGHFLAIRSMPLSYEDCHNQSADWFRNDSFLILAKHKARCNPATRLSITFSRPIPGIFPGWTADPGRFPAVFPNPAAALKDGRWRSSKCRFSPPTPHAPG